MKTIELKCGLIAAYNHEEILDALPTVFYFTLSKEASLTIDPFNQFTLFFQGKNIRIVSFDLPYHSSIETFHTAIEKWSHHFKQGQDILTPFFEKIVDAIEELIIKGIVDKDNISVAGLSRGALVACHIASRHPLINTIVGFAPLTNFSKVKEFKDTPYNKQLDLINITTSLIGKELRFYIGNRDTRVSVESCFEFINTLSIENHEAKIRPIKVELIIQASQGHLGHGTLTPTFENGALWIQKKIKIV